MKRFFIFVCAAAALMLAGACEQTPVEIDAEEIILDETSVVMDKGDTLSLEATVLPENATNKTILWLSADEEVATVSAKGLVTALNTGETIISVLCGTAKAECSVTVSPVVASSIQLDAVSMELTVGQVRVLNAVVLPEDTENKTIMWSSSDESIATVSNDGEVTAIAVGETSITAVCGDAKAECMVTVVPVPVESITLNESEIDMLVGDTYQLTATVLPENAGDKDVAWSSSDNGVATVDGSGLVTAVAAGEAVITASCGGHEAECRVTSVMPEPKVGDIFYSDGTYSTGLDETKVPIGVIFYVGDPSVDDAAMKEDHPDCVNGLVVGLKNETGDWQTEYQAYGKTVSSWIEANTGYAATATGTYADSNFNRMLGYNNTKGYEAFNASPENASWPVDIAERVVAYRETVPAPGNTTDWYIPSPKETAVLCIGGPIEESIYRLQGTENKDAINAVLEIIPGADLLTDSNWWSSAEMLNGTGVYISNITYGSHNSNSFGKTSPIYLTRYILAF